MAFFRKRLMGLMQLHGWAIGPQILASGLVFGAVHAICGLFGGNLRSFFIAMGFTGVLGSALGSHHIFGGRHLGPCVWSQS